MPTSECQHSIYLLLPTENHSQTFVVTIPNMLCVWLCVWKKKKKRKRLLGNSRRVGGPLLFYFLKNSFALQLPKIEEMFLFWQDLRCRDERKLSGFQILFS